MKYYNFILLLSTIFLSACATTKQESKNSDSPTIISSYFGQKPPSLIPEIFAPGIVSISERSEGSISFSPDLNEMYFQADDENEKPTIYFSKLEGNKWAPIEKPAFTKGAKDEQENPFVSHNGKRIYFTAFSSDMSDTRIWYVSRLGHSWSDPLKLDLPNDDKVLLNSQTKKGDLHYFNFSKRKSYYASYNNGGFPEAKEFEIEPGLYHRFFSQNEDYFVAHGPNKEDEGRKDSDLYVSFKEQDGTWAKPINLGGVVNSNVSEQAPTITPDGKYMFFSRYEEDGTKNVYWVSTEVIENLRPKSSSYTIGYSSNGIVLTDNEGKSKNRISTNGGYTAWSPDGKRLAFYAKYDERKTWSIHTMDSDGTNRKRLTHVKNRWDNSPTWSPDGTKIAFSREYEDLEKNWQEEVWIMNSDGSQQTQIKPIKGGGPYFTPDGRIVFHSAFKDKKSEISIADIDGNNIIHLIDNEAEEQHPEVSPNGLQIAFMSDRDGNKEIYVMNIDGSNQKRLTSSKAAEWYPSWSPDGSKIIFSSTSMNGERNIYMMNKDGSSLRKIITNGTQPAWSKIAN